MFCHSFKLDWFIAFGPPSGKGELRPTYYGYYGYSDAWTPVFLGIQRLGAQDLEPSDVSAGSRRIEFTSAQLPMSGIEVEDLTATLVSSNIWRLDPADRGSPKCRIN